MELYIKVGLTKNEKAVIHRVANYQIDSLKKILDNEIEDTDTLVWSSQNGVDYEELLEEVSANIDLYRELLVDPQQVFELPENEVSVFLHILNTCIDNYPKARRKLVRKFDFRAKLINNLN